MKHLKFKNIKSNKRIRNKTNTFLFYLLCVLTLSLTVGYAAINSDVSVSGEASFRTIEEIRISDVRMHEVTNGALESYSSNYNKDTVITGVDLPYTNSTITYKVEVTNYGSVAMKIDSITNESFNNNDMEYTTSGYTLNTFVSPGQTVELYITFKYKTTITTLPTNTKLDSNIKLNFVKPESILAVGSNGNGTSTFLYGTLKKNQIESVEFRPTIDVGESAIGSWDASLNRDATVIAWYTDTNSNNKYELYIGGNGEVELSQNSSNLFAYFTQLKTINFNNSLNTSKSVNMEGFFRNCNQLTSIDLSQLNTSNVTNMTRMFASASRLSSIDLSALNTSKVTNMSYMFSSAIALKTIDISSFDVSNVTNASYMFQNTRVTEIDLSAFTSNKLQDISHMLASANNLTDVDLSVMNLSGVTNMSYLFSGCESLQEITLTGVNTSNVTNMTALFNNCYNLGSIDLSDLDTENVVYMSAMFLNCTNLEEVDISSFDTSNVQAMNFMFALVDDYGYGYGIRNIIGLSNLDTSSVITMAGMFTAIDLTGNIDLSSWDVSNVLYDSEIDYNNDETSPSYFMWDGNNDLATAASTHINDNFGFADMFSQSTITSLNLSTWALGDEAYLSRTFYSMNKITNLDIRNMDFATTQDKDWMVSNVNANCLITIKNNTTQGILQQINSNLNNFVIASS